MTARSRPGLPLARIDAIDDVLGRPPPPPPPAPTPRRAAAPEEPADPDQVLRDYVLAPYPPLGPIAGGLAAVNLLVESFAIAGVEAAGAAVLARLRAQLGPGRVVWGVKLNSSGLVAEPPSIPAKPGASRHSIRSRRETGGGPDGGGGASPSLLSTTRGRGGQRQRRRRGRYIDQPLTAAGPVRSRV